MVLREGRVDCEGDVWSGVKGGKGRQRGEEAEWARMKRAPFAIPKLNQYKESGLDSTNSYPAATPPPVSPSVHLVRPPKTL